MQMCDVLGHGEIQILRHRLSDAHVTKVQVLAANQVTTLGASLCGTYVQPSTDVPTSQQCTFICVYFEMNKQNIRV